MNYDMQAYEARIAREKAQADRAALIAEGSTVIPVMDEVTEEDVKVHKEAEAEVSEDAPADVQPEEAETPKPKPSNKKA